MSTTASPLPPDTLQKVIDGQLPLNTFFDLGPEHIEALAAVGASLYQQGRIDEAQEAFEGLVAFDSTRYEGYAGLGAIALSRGELDKAQEFLTTAAARKADEPTVLSNLGEVQLRLGHAEEAAATFKKALALDPDCKDAGANRARAILHGMQVVFEHLKKQAGA